MANPSLDTVLIRWGTARGELSAQDISILSMREQRKARQGEVRACLRAVVDETAGRWTTAEILTDLVKSKYPHIANAVELKSITEHLKTLHLRKKHVIAYLCEERTFSMRSYWQSKEEIEIRRLLYDYITQSRGQWTTVKEIMKDMSNKFPALCGKLSEQMIVQRLEEMKLKTKNIPTNVYYCEKQYFDF